MAWPPYTETQTVVTTTIGGERIMLETRLAGNRHDDWAEYADLALYGALDAWNEGDSALARDRYHMALALFDGVGFSDKAYQADGLYATYKLALALYVAQVIGEPPDPEIGRILWAMQAPLRV